MAARGARAAVGDVGEAVILQVGVFWRPSNPSYKNLLSRFDAVVRATGAKVVLLDVERRADLEPAFETIKKSRIDGLLVQADDLFINEGTRIIALAASRASRRSFLASTPRALAN